VIEEADRLTLPAANALLKITEEPPVDTVIILSTANGEGVINTLQSRAQAIYFPSPSEGEWEAEAEAFRLGGGDPDLARSISEYGCEHLRSLLEKYLQIIKAGDILQVYSLFPLEKEETLLFLQALAETSKDLIVKRKVSPQFLQEISTAMEMIRRQVNARLVLEVLALKHIRLGGIEIG